MNEEKLMLAEIVGGTNVLENPVKGGKFSSTFPLNPPMRPHFMVKPRSVDEVQKIVRWANRTNTPLVPMSSGAPHFLGTVPTAPGSTIVDLGGMDQILKIDRRHRLALIQPGVTYRQLLPELRKRGLRINMPLMPRGNKSVIASLLEREPLMSPRYHWNLAEPLRSLEIVWGNGDKLYSGSGVFRGEKASDWEEGLVPLVGPGPGQQLDFYKFVSAAQGSMGMVTWASVKCEVFPETRKLFIVPAPELADLIDFTYKLLKFRFGDELFLMNGAGLASLLAETADGIESLRALLPPWAVILGITGGQILAKEKLEAEEWDLRDIAQQSALSMLPEVPGCRSNELLELLLEPSEEPYWKVRYKGNAEELFFLTTLDRTPEFVTAMNSSADEHRYPPCDIGIYIQPAHQGVTCHCEFILPVDREDAPEVDKVRELFRDASFELFRRGAFFSRPYGIWAGMVYDADAMTREATRKVKKIFDPNNVMNPGKLCF